MFSIFDGDGADDVVYMLDVRFAGIVSQDGIDTGFKQASTQRMRHKLYQRQLTFVAKEDSLATCCEDDDDNSAVERDVEGAARAD